MKAGVEFQGGSQIFCPRNHLQASPCYRTRKACLYCLTSHESVFYPLKPIWKYFYHQFNVGSFILYQNTECVFFVTYTNCR